MKLADTVFARNGDGNDRLFFVANDSGLLSATARHLALGYILLVDAATMTAHLSDFNARVHFDSSTLTDVQLAGEQEPASNGRAQCNGVQWQVCFQTKDLSLAGKAWRGNGAKRDCAALVEIQELPVPLRTDTNYAGYATRR